MKARTAFGHRALLAWAAAFAIGSVGGAGDANAAFEEKIPTKVGLIKWRGNPAAGKLYKLVSKAPKTGPLFQLPSADPATTGTDGNLTAVLVGKGRVECTLKAQAFNGTEGWKTLGPTASPKGYKYINKSAPGGAAGPCKLVLLKEKVIKVIAKGTGSMAAPVDKPPGNPDVDSVLTLGASSDEKYCALWVGTQHFKEKANKLIKAKSQAAPTACPVIPPTTTTTVGATTTTTGGGTTTTTVGGTTTTTVGGTTTTVQQTTTTTSAPTTTTTVPPPLDHYRLYQAFGFVDPPLVTLDDQFQHQVVDPGLPVWFMPPVRKNVEPVTDPVSHLTCYDLIDGTGAFGASVDVDNQFGLQNLTVRIPLALCVPTEKLFPPTLGPVSLDHYKCYEAEGGHVGGLVSLSDQFQDEVGVQVMQPIFFCAPVDKNGEPRVNDRDHLTCYLTEPPGSPVVAPVSTINQFGEDQLDVLPPFALCVPSLKLGWTPLPTTTTSTTVQQTTTTTVQTTTTTTTTLPQPLDHYRVYLATGPVAPQVSVIDQFLTEDIVLGDVAYFMVPVDKNGEFIINPVDHLTCYDIDLGVFGTFINVLNQFGPQSLQVQQQDTFCVPTEKFPVGTPLTRDHYKCYEASGNPPPLQVNLMDQFQDELGVVVHQPFLFCNPADKNGEGISNPFDHLTCYLTDPPGLAPGLVPISNQFHLDVVLDVGPPVGLCVPSDKFLGGSSKP